MSTQLINRTERLTTIEKMLFQAGSGLRVVEIAAVCNVDRRTIYRDLALLSEIGVPVYQKDGRYFLNHDYYVATVRLNVNELTALYLAARGLDYSSAQQNPHVVSAMKKLGKNLPQPIAEHVRYMLELVRGNPVDRAFVTLLETLTRAWAEQRKVKLWYRGPHDSQVSVREFALYFIEPTTHGGLYAVGYDYQTQRVGAIRLQWVKRAQLLTAPYTAPATLDRQRYAADEWGMMRSNVSGRSVTVLLSFAPEVAPQLRERYSHLHVQVDNRCVVRLQVADWHEIVPWVRSWGSNVEVLEPLALRDEIAVEAQKVAAVYGSVSTAS
jgi:predicted DNA-binding transcriptional regulator YafY